MRKQILIYFTFVFLFTVTVCGNARADSFDIRNTFDPNYTRFIESNAEAFRLAVYSRYFEKKSTVPVTLYFSRSESVTIELLKQNGHKAEAPGAYYIPSVPAIYAHYLGADGKPCGWKPMNRAIVDHYIMVNYPALPDWFKADLADYIAEQTVLVKNRLVLGPLSPQQQEILQQSLDPNEGVGDSLKKLMSVSARKFDDWPQGRAYSRAFIYWLDDANKLKEFLAEAQKQGYKLPSLETAILLRYGQIKEVFAGFIDTQCCTGKDMLSGFNAGDEEAKRAAFTKVLQTNPKCIIARLELAKSYNRDKNYVLCRENLNEILTNPDSILFRQAALLMGNTYYVEKDFIKALEYYQKAWGYSNLSEYKYRLAYQIANCHYYLNDRVNARRWYKQFIELKWSPDDMKSQGEYAMKFLSAPWN